MFLNDRRSQIIIRSWILLLVIAIGSFSPAIARPLISIEADSQNAVDQPNGPFLIYLPVVSNIKDNFRVNVPYFDNDVDFNKTAIFWFGKVTSSDNYADVRVGYSQSELYVHVAVFDRLLWYDPNPVISQLTQWDSVSLYLNLIDRSRGAPSQSSYRFDAQFTWWESPRTNWQASYRGNGSGWGLVSIPFTTVSNWFGNLPNDTLDDRGWIIDYHIPFTSLGLTAPPPQNTTWGLGMALHDRDNASVGPNPDKYWPESFKPDDLSTWGQLGFGIPVYTPQAYKSPQTIMIRRGLNDAGITDGMVGGSSVCGEGLDFWNDWGSKNYGGSQFFNIQNEIDVSDWPCYSKYYITFPLSVLPSGKIIVSAKLTLHLFGNAGAAGQAQPSFIQVMRVNQDWDVDTISWNNAPLSCENYSGTWVNPMTGPLVWPGVAYDWDVSRAVADAYSREIPLRLVLYDSDFAYHSGKYFVSSNAEDWNAAGRPTIQIILGDPVVN